MELPRIGSAEELEALIRKIGFLPFFRSDIPGFSMEECVSPDRWFVEGVDGPWEWKGEIAAKGEIAYGKLFHNKAGFVAREWYPHLANYRRNGYDFDARYEDGLASRKCKRVIDILSARGPLLSYEIKRLGNFGKSGEKGFDSTITELQMQTYVTVKTFEYRIDRYGHPYGWGVARYALSEDMFGAEFVTSAYSIQPELSKQKIQAYLAKLFPDAAERQIELLVRR